MWVQVKRVHPISYPHSRVAKLGSALPWFSASQPTKLAILFSVGAEAQQESTFTTRNRI